jgi:pyruvate kinase
VDTDARLEEASAAALKSGKVSPGDLVVITAGHPVRAAGTTNMLKVKKL